MSTFSNFLPRPHHELSSIRQNNNFSDQLKPNRALNALINAHPKYEPVPDGRFYTKANFFTLKDFNNNLS
jgi:hypothetical protein